MAIMNILLTRVPITTQRTGVMMLAAGFSLKVTSKTVVCSGGLTSVGALAYETHT
jgi:hypothetical protein